MKFISFTDLKLFYIILFYIILYYKTIVYLIFYRSKTIKGMKYNFCKFLYEKVTCTYELAKFSAFILKPLNYS